MAIHQHTRIEPRPDLALRRLVEGQNLGRYAFFFVTGEGDEFPNGVEESSGFVLNENGSVFSFWTGWDEGRDEEILTEWAEVEPEPNWMEDPEYRRARRAVGLD